MDTTQNCGEVPLFVWNWSDEFWGTALEGCGYDDWDSIPAHDRRLLDVLSGSGTKSCLYCLIHMDDLNSSEHMALRCPRCGFLAKEQSFYPTRRFIHSVKRLAKFNLSDSKVAIAELGTYLKRKFDDVRHVDPLRFQDLVEDIFRKSFSGLIVSRPSKQKDGGFDFSLLWGHEMERELVQVRLTKNAVGVAAVRELCGIQTRFRAKRLRFVTNSYYTRDVLRESPHLASTKFELELTNGNELVELLNVYNADLPPLTSEDVRRTFGDI